MSFVRHFLYPSRIDILPHAFDAVLKSPGHIPKPERDITLSTFRIFVICKAGGRRRVYEPRLPQGPCSLSMQRIRTQRIALVRY
ncbi:hypothetical protein PILCRDRAFT_824758 [Piloderma croceum F 1598]|uniref:Uncharacterized protein n=1 Tax=Piloderma croceum (strain F 1598) TaxID=765440 RepID=A0A0C3BL33_PILCF|nr:hypothetical protein PILCRDRAFT_824758 [Piloderma croceum F 1598]